MLANGGKTTFELETSGGVNNVCAPRGQGGGRQNLCKPALCSLEEEVMGTLWREQKSLLRKESDSKHLGARRGLGSSPLQLLREGSGAYLVECRGG